MDVARLRHAAQFLTSAAHAPLRRTLLPDDSGPRTGEPALAATVAAMCHARAVGPSLLGPRHAVMALEAVRLALDGPEDPGPHPATERPPDLQTLHGDAAEIVAAAAVLCGAVCGLAPAVVRADYAPEASERAAAAAACSLDALLDLYALYGSVAAALAAAHDELRDALGRRDARATTRATQSLEPLQQLAVTGGGRVAALLDARRALAAAATGVLLLVLLAWDAVCLRRTAKAGEVLADPQRRADLDELLRGPPLEWASAAATAATAETSAAAHDAGRCQALYERLTTDDAVVSALAALDSFVGTARRTAVDLMGIGAAASTRALCGGIPAVPTACPAVPAATAPTAARLRDLLSSALTGAAPGTTHAPALRLLRPEPHPPPRPLPEAATIVERFGDMATLVGADSGLLLDTHDDALSRLLSALPKDRLASDARVALLRSLCRPAPPEPLPLLFGGGSAPLTREGIAAAMELNKESVTAAVVAAQRWGLPCRADLLAAVVAAPLSEPQCDIVFKLVAGHSGEPLTDEQLSARREKQRPAAETETAAPADPPQTKRRFQQTPAKEGRDPQEPPLPFFSTATLSAFASAGIAAVGAAPEGKRGRLLKLFAALLTNVARRKAPAFSSEAAAEVCTFAIEHSDTAECIALYAAVRQSLGLDSGAPTAVTAPPPRPQPTPQGTGSRTGPQLPGRGGFVRR